MEAHHTVRGVTYLVIGLAVFSLMDVIIKLLSDTFPAHEIVFVRGIVAIVPLALITYWQGGWRYFRTKRWRGHLVRGILGFGSFTFYYMALSVLSLPEAVALSFMSPIFITIFSALFLGEEIHIRRWTAIAVAFAGVLVITQPGLADFKPAWIFALLSAMFYAGMTMMTRRIANTESGATTAFYAMVFFIFGSIVTGLFIGDGKFSGSGEASAEFLFRAWQMPQLTELLLMAATGIIASVGFYCLSHAYRDAPMSVVSLFEYSSMPWAILWGYVFWQTVPTSSTLIGLAMIVGSGLYIFYRERKVRKKIAR